MEGVSGWLPSRSCEDHLLWTFGGRKDRRAGGSWWFRRHTSDRASDHKARIPPRRYRSLCSFHKSSLVSTTGTSYLWCPSRGHSRSPRFAACAYSFIYAPQRLLYSRPPKAATLRKCLLQERVCSSPTPRLLMPAPSPFAVLLTLDSAKLPVIQVSRSSKILSRGAAVLWWSTQSSFLTILSTLEARLLFEQGHAQVTELWFPGPSCYVDFRAAIPKDGLQEPLTQRVPPPSSWCTLAFRQSDCTAPRATHL